MGVVHQFNDCQLYLEEFSSEDGSVLHEDTSSSAVVTTVMSVIIPIILASVELSNAEEAIKNKKKALDAAATNKNKALDAAAQDL